MQEQKIAIIIHQKKENSAHLLIESLKNLIVPDNFSVDVLMITGGTNIAQAYNEAMKKSDAKYKVYLFEECVVTDPMMLIELIDILQSNKKIAAAGVSGVKQLPTNGQTYKAMHRTGSLYIGREKGVVDWEPADEKYVSVMSLDKFCIATQYDIDWRDDLFHTGCFYESAQSIEYTRQGWLNVVVKQSAPFIWWVGTDLECDEKSREIFLNEYSKDCFPVVSVIIPTYNRPIYFKKALESVLEQTYRNLDIFITDNSHNNETKKLVQKYLNEDLRIHYEHHPDYDAGGNWGRAIAYNRETKAEYVNWLMDDDLFAPQKIEKMIQVYFDYPEVSLVTSYRQRIDTDGTLLADTFNKPFFDRDRIADGKAVCETMLMTLNNYVGEPTSVLIKKKYQLNGGLGWNGREGKYLISDFTTWLRCLTQGDLYYFREPLSSFRQHDDQDQKQFSTRVNILICWAIEIEYAVETKQFLQDKEDLERAISRWMLLYANLLNDMLNEGYHTAETKKICWFVKKWAELIAEAEGLN